MSSQPTRYPNPNTLDSSNERNSKDTPVNPKTSSQQTTEFDGRQRVERNPQLTSQLRSQSTPDLPSTAWNQPSTSVSRPTPLIVVTGSPEAITSQEATPSTESAPRQGRPLVSRHRSGNSSSQPPRRSSTPYSRPRSRSQPQGTRTATVTAMSSASSSPGNTSTSGPSGSYGSGSGSNPSYHLPYAPFPYPMPGNAANRGGQGNQGSNSGSGK
ncbi:hypothetical protein K469DRAFT_686753 [Zopfia rhizophila CBS 207.26]|uniref:Uncharacterized protein n=1 Tax=Zopfia rhizophila CBS 207.26 TaxID=1314779 RepID=A0A6A6EUW1_9PEZI|nr:hypothetical protein K469DRAFT_686753 [Zopfia rhizophila CBS 207.26]